MPLLACMLLAMPAQAQRKPRIKGNRQVIEVSDNLPPFRHLRLTDDLEIHLERGDSEGFRLEVDDNLVDVLRFEVADSTLVIASFYSITGSKKLDITVMYHELASIRAEAGSLVSEEVINGEALAISATEAASLQLRLRASLITLEMDGNSRADLNAEADSLYVDLSGQADASLYTVNQGMGLNLGGNASLNLEGVSTEAAVHLTENSSLKAEGMVANRLRAGLDASAVARLRAEAEFELDAAGGSRTYLYGQPQIRIARFSDRAELHKEPD
jgi:hypothetical protein